MSCTFPKCHLSMFKSLPKRILKTWPRQNMGKNNKSFFLAYDIDI